MSREYIGVGMEQEQGVGVYIYISRQYIGLGMEYRSRNSYPQFLYTSLHVFI